MSRPLRDLTTISSILAALSLPANSAVAADVFVKIDGKFLPFDQSKARLMPKQELVFKIDGIDYQVKHSDMIEILNKVKMVPKYRSIGIKIHEETKLIDFGAFDDLVIRLPIGDVKSTAPNGANNER